MRLLRAHSRPGCSVFTYSCRRCWHRRRLVPRLLLAHQRPHLPAGREDEKSRLLHHVSALEFRVYRVNDPRSSSANCRRCTASAGRRRACRSRRKPGWSAFTPGSTASGLGSAISFASNFRPTRATAFACGAGRNQRHSRKGRRSMSTRRFRCLISSSWFRNGSGTFRRASAGRASVSRFPSLTRVSISSRPRTARCARTPS